MKIIIRIILLVCLIYLSSCSEHTDISDVKNAVKIDFSKIDVKYNNSDIVSDVRLVALETTKDNLFGYIYKIKTKGDTLYIKDFDTPSIFLFDSNGRYISKVSRHGKSNIEYVNITDFDVDASGNVIILDGDSKKINSYKSDGTFIESDNFDFIANTMELMSDDIVVFEVSGDTEAKLVMWSRKAKQIVGKYIDNSDILFTSYAWSPFVKYNDKVYFHYQYSNIIYNVTEQGVSKELFFDFGKYNITSGMMTKHEFGFYYPSSENVNIERFIETDKYFILECQLSTFENEYGVACLLCCNKESGEQKIITETHFTDDILFQGQMLGSFSYSPKLGYITGLLPTKIIDNIDKIDTSRVKSNIELKDITPEHNPIIIFYNIN